MCSLLTNITHNDSAVCRILIKLTYGEKIWAEMGEDLVHSDIEAVDRLTKAIFTFWYVDVFHFCEFRFFFLAVYHLDTHDIISALYTGLVSWFAFQVSFWHLSALE
jgi:hypothetical protein